MSHTHEILTREQTDVIARGFAMVVAALYDADRRFTSTPSIQQIQQHIRYGGPAPRPTKRHIPT